MNARRRRRGVDGVAMMGAQFGPNSESSRPGQSRSERNFILLRITCDLNRVKFKSVYLVMLRGKPRREHLGGMTLFLADEQAERRAGEPVGFPELPFKKSNVGRADVLRVSAKQSEGGRLRGDLGDECGLRRFCWFALPNRERMRFQDFLEPLIERSSRHTLIERRIDTVDVGEQLMQRIGLSGRPKQYGCPG